MRASRRGRRRWWGAAQHSGLPDAAPLALGLFPPGFLDEAFAGCTHMSIFVCCLLYSRPSLCDGNPTAM